MESRNKVIIINKVKCYLLWKTNYKSIAVHESTIKGIAGKK